MSRARATSDLIIAPVREEDLPAVLAIEAATFSAPWTEEMFRWELEQAGTGLAWVARRGERVVGYLFTW
ncbi:MAG: ribosomal protein S18-alanine N-acetyltransferase, partial [Candidatus Methylomirabilales bacterium]